LHRVDLADAAAVQELASGLGELDGLVLCAAPPPLPMALTAETAGELSRYVAASLELAAVPLAALAPLLRRRGSWLLAFSAAAVEEPNRELPQLSAAKSALEGLARAAAATLPGTAVVIARVPRMRTDLVNTPAARLRAAPPEVIAAELADLLTGESLEPGVTVATPTGAGVPAP
ncbi:MAG TPA: SDR family oxidoreductase, partial [Solirubrobacteraceae bacterium]|nr:SDR family oxidoreductase [Solirubrobacteraceae bacterium]